MLHFYTGVTYDSGWVSILEPITIAKVTDIYGEENPIFKLSIYMGDWLKWKIGENSIYNPDLEYGRRYTYDWPSNTLIKEPEIKEPEIPPSKGISWGVPVLVGSVVALTALVAYSKRKR